MLLMYVSDYLPQSVSLVMAGDEENPDPAEKRITDRRRVHRQLYPQLGGLRFGQNER